MKCLRLVSCFFMILFLFGCGGLPDGILPPLKNLESLQIYDERGNLISGRGCVPRQDGGETCTTIFPDGEKTVAEYGPGEPVQEK